MNTREKILDVAHKHFSARGYSDTSLEDIAYDVGIKKSSLYYFFKNKDDLYSAMFDHVYARIIDRMDAYYARVQEKKASLALVIEDLLQPCVHRDNDISVMDLEALRGRPALRKKLLTRMNEIHLRFAKLLKLYSVPEPLIAAHIVIDMIHAYAIRSAHGYPVVPVKKFSAYLSSLFRSSTPIQKQRKK